MPPLNAVIIRADLVSETVQSEWTARTSAAEPAACGLDIDVPLMVPYAPRLMGNAAKMSTPGPVISGLVMSWYGAGSGPRKLKSAKMSP